MKSKSKEDSVANDDDLDIPPTPPDFFKNAVMGKYYHEYVRRHGRKPVRAVTLEEDVAAVFRDSESVNNVLRAIILSMSGTKKRKKRKAA
jgi:hypothetical protein